MMKKNNKEKNFISAVVYVRNEQENIADFLKLIDQTFSDNFEQHEVILVNDCSEDDGISIAKKIGNKTKGVLSIINMSYHSGIEASMNAGIDLAIGDFIFEFDSMELDFDLKYIMESYYECLQGNDIVSICPKTNVRLSSKLFYKVYNVSKKNVSKLQTERFQIVSRRAINRVKDLNKTIPYRKALYANCGLKKAIILYVPNKRVKKKREKSSYRKEVAVDSIILFTDFTYKISLTMLLAIMVILLGVAIYTVMVFLKNNPIEGWTTTMLLLSFAFFGVFAILTVILKYLSLITNLIFKKQDYIIESIEKVSK